MTIPYRQLEDALVASDPAARPSAPPLAGRLAPRVRAIENLREGGGSTALWGRHAIGETLERWQELRRLPRLSTICGLAVPPDRYVIVAAHGPSLLAALPELKRSRARLFLVAPFRTALFLAAHGVCPDVTVLADRGATEYGWNARAWRACARADRAALTRDSALVVEPLAPRELYRSFRRVYFFDCGLEVLPRSATLPFWGYALVSSLSLPLSLSAKRVAIVGVDLHGESGPSQRSWDDGIVPLDDRMRPLLELLETLAECDVELVDLGATSIRKRGWRHLGMAEYLAGPVSGMVGGAATDATADVEAVTAALGRRLTQQIDQLEEVLATIRSRSLEGLAKLRALETAGDGEARAALAVRVREVEREWPRDQRLRAAVEMLQATFVLNLWTLAEQVAVRPRDRDEADRKKARLVFAELDLLTRRHKEVVSAARATLAASPVRATSNADGIARVGIVGTGPCGQDAATWLRERHALEAAMFFDPAAEAPAGLTLEPERLRACDLVLLATDGDRSGVRAALEGLGLRAYQDYLDFRPSAPPRRPSVAEDILPLVDGVNVTDLDDLGQEIRLRVADRSSLRADYWAAIYKRIVHDLRDTVGFDPRGKAVLEIGTGSGVGPLVLFRVAGARCTCSCDFQPLVKPYAAPYRELLAHVLMDDELLATRPRLDPNEIVQRFRQLVTWEGERANFNHGLLALQRASVTALPFASNVFDLVYSNAVLEHIPDVPAALAEMARVLRPGGVAMHRIDLSDHGSRTEPHQFLRYSDPLWAWLNRHQVYTENRLRRSDFLRLFESAGLRVAREWPARVCPVTDAVLAEMHPRFRAYDRDDLAVVSLTVIARKEPDLDSGAAG